MRLRESDGKTIPLGQMLNFATFDIMGDLTFGQPLGLLESSEYSSWVKNVFDAVRVLPLVQMIEYYPLLSKIYKFLEPKAINEMKTSHFKHSADRVDKRLEKTSGKLWASVMVNDTDSSANTQTSAKTSQTSGILSCQQRKGRASACPRCIQMPIFSCWPVLIRQVRLPMFDLQYLVIV